MKKYLITLIAGILLIGIGASVTVFEFSRYSYTDSPPSSLFDETTETLYTDLTPGKNVQFSGYPVTVAVDNALGDRAKVEVTTNGAFYRLHLNNSNNRLYLNLDGDPFKILTVSLDALKRKQFFSYNPNVTVKLYLSEAYAKNFVATSSREQAYSDQNRIDSLQEDYENRIESLQNDYENRLQQIQTTYDTTLEEQQNRYDTQIEQMQNEHQRQIEQLQMQIDRLNDKTT